MTDRLAYREGKIGASDAPVIAGVSPWSTPLQLWEEKLGIRKPRETNSAMQRGIDREEQARLCFERLMQIEVLPQVLTHPKKEWMIASLDGLSIDGLTAVEIKCAGREDHDLAKTYNAIPEKYFPQLQHQLAVSGLQSMYYFSYRSDDDYALVEVQREDDYIMLLLRNEERFYECMQSFTPPASTERDIERKTDSEWKKVSTEWLTCTALLKELVDMEAMLREEIIALAGEKNCSGAGIEVKKVSRKGAIDYDAAAKDMCIDFERYRKKPTLSYRIFKTGESEQNETA